MKMRIMVPAALALALTAAAVISMTRHSTRPATQTPGVATHESVSVTEAWARATPPGAEVAGVFVTIVNEGAEPVRVTGVTSPSAASAIIHATADENGVSTMRGTDVAIGPGETLQMMPGGTHIMLMGLKMPLKQGEMVSVTLAFDRDGTRTVEARIGSLGATGPMD